MKICILIILLFSIQHGNTQNKDSLDLVDFLSPDSMRAKSLISIPTSDSSLKEAIANYNSFALNHRIDAYKWQLLCSKIIFFVSILIVLIGLYLSYLQFQLSKTGFEGRSKKVRRKQDSTEGESENVEVQTVTSFQLGKEGIKIDSAVIGLIILIVSVLFFFMYLKFAFHINDFGQ